MAYRTEISAVRGILTHRFELTRGEIVTAKPKVALAMVSALCLAAMSACGSSSGSGPGAGDDLSGQKLVYVNYGGDSMKAAQKAWLDPFRRKTGVQIATDSPSDPAKVKAMVDAGNPTWDVIDLDTASGANGCGTMFAKRSETGVDIKDVDPKYVTDECGVPVLVQAVALVYNTAKFGGNPPTKITDFMDTGKFPGQRLIFNYALGGLDPILLASGVAPDKLYPLDTERAAASVRALGRNLTLEATLAQQTQDLESGNFSMCLCYVGRAALSAQHGAPIGVVWDKAWEAWDAVYAIKGSKAPKAQSALLNYLATPAAQSAFTEQLPYGPTTPASKPQVPAEFKKWLPQDNLAQMGPQGEVVSDLKWWTSNSDKAFAAWTAMTAG